VAFWFGPIRLVDFHQDAILQHQSIHLGSHETSICIFRRANNRLAAHIERCIYDYRTAGQLVERIDHVVVDRLIFASDGLYARRVIDVSNRRYVAPLNLDDVEQVPVAVLKLEWPAKILSHLRD